MSEGIRAAPYRREMEKEWDAFVAKADGGTLFHSQAFLGYHGAGMADRFRHLVFHRGEKLVAALPLGADPETEGARMRSPWGASFGGLVAAEPHYARSRDLVAALLGFARESGWSALSLTPAPSVYHAAMDASMEFCLLRSGFILASRELCQAVDLRALPTDPIDAFAYACAKQIRKALRQGVEVRPTADLPAFHAILTANRLRHGVTPTHTLEDLFRLRDRIPDAFFLLGAYREGELEGGLLGFAANPRVFLNFYTCSREEAGGLGVDNLLNHAAILLARERGHHYYDFGTSSLRMQPNEGLIRFKESFGGGSILRDTYTWEAS